MLESTAGNLAVIITSAIVAAALAVTGLIARYQNRRSDRTGVRRSEPF